MASRFASTVIGALLVVPAATTAAAEWRYTPTVMLQSGYDDNLQLRTSDERAVTSAALEASADIVAASDRFRLSMRPRVRSLRFSNDEELDRTDPFADVDLVIGRERQRWTVGGHYSRESTLTSEFDSTGFVQTDVDRTESTFTAGWDRVTGERGSLQVALLDTDLSYDEAFLSPLVGYRYSRVQTAYSRVLDARSTLTVGASHGQLASEQSRGTTDSDTLTASWTHAFSTALSTTIGIGWFDTTSEDVSADDTAGTSLNFSVQRRLDAWRLTAAGGRALQPDGRGTFVREDSVEIRAERRLTERLSGGVAWATAQTETLGLPFVFDRREYSRAGVSLRWQAAKRWALNVDVVERRQRYFDSVPADSTAATLSLYYRGR